MFDWLSKKPIVATAVLTVLIFMAQLALGNGTRYGGPVGPPLPGSDAIDVAELLPSTDDPTLDEGGDGLDSDPASNPLSIYQGARCGAWLFGLISSLLFVAAVRSLPAGGGSPLWPVRPDVRSSTRG